MKKTDRLGSSKTLSYPNYRSWLTHNYLIMILICLIPIFLVADLTKQDSLFNQLSEVDETTQVELLEELAQMEGISADQRIEYLRQAVEIADKLNYPTGKGYALYELGHAYNTIGDFEQALSVAMESLKIFSSNGNDDYEANVHSLIGMLYFYLENFDSAINHLETALEIRQQSGDQLQIANAVTNLGNLMGITGNFPQALEYYQSALKIREATNDLGGKSQLYNNIANVYLAMDELDKVLPYREKALAIDRETGDSWQIALKTYNLAEYYLIINEPEKAYPFIIESKSIAEDLENRGLIDDNIHFLAWYYELIQDYDNALKYQKLYTQSIKETFSLELSDQVGEMKVKYETEKKEKEAQTAKIQLKTAYTQKLALIFIVVIMLIIAIFILILFYKKKRDSQLLERLIEARTKELLIAKERAEENEEKIKTNLLEKTALLQELFHRTKNNMAIISAILSMESGRTNNEYLKNTFRDIKNKIQAMSLVQNKLYKSGNLSNINFKEYIQDLYTVIRQSFGVNPDKINITYDLQDVNISIDSAVPLGLVINELLSNIFKHAFPEDKGDINIKLLKNDEGFIHLSLSDNGVGLPPNYDPRKNALMGLTTVFSIIDKQLKGEINTDTSNGLAWFITINDSKRKERV